MDKLKKTVEANVIKISPAVAPEPGVSSRAAQTPSVHMNDVTITFKGADGEIMTIRRANSAAGSGLICVDVNSTEASSSASQQNFTPSLNSGSKKADKR
ncbi:MAG: hypothetical protein L7F77_10540 [Candidatus Magnetominusculus sp. LBB02]|nr:hypothetical protein [Candidatus Magnetominusculus sp. LBB02]